jgi:organic hydroperoxide reductase OsmC/OhrA
MSEHVATVEWQADGGFRSGRYSRVHRIGFDGGAALKGSASPHVVPLPMSDPAGVDPEELLVAAVSACHMLWFLHLARDAGLDVASYRDSAAGTMAEDEAGRTAIVKIVLRPEIAFAGEAPDSATLARLHHEAHEACFVANSLKTQIVVEG